MLKLPSMRVRKGFTLIELLVVIAIIAILAAILFPVFARARDRARTATCQSNLKQFNTAIMMWESDNEGKILPGSTATGMGVYTDTPHTSWLGLINPYMKILRVPPAPNDVYLHLNKDLLCPFAPNMKAPPDNSEDVRRPYGYNAVYLGSGTPRSSSIVKSPAATIRILEVWQFRSDVGPYGQGSLFCWPPATQSSVTDYTYPPGWHTNPASQYTKNDAISRNARLDGRVMVLWMDGHVAAMSGRKVFYGNGTVPTDAYFDPTVANKP